MKKKVTFIISCIVCIMIIIAFCSDYIQTKIELVDVKYINEKLKNNIIPYKELLPYQENYEATKQYFCYNKDTINQEDTCKFDEKGIAIRYKDNKAIYNPVTISQYGLNQYSHYIETDDNQYYEKAKCQADYLLEIQDKKNGKFYYNYDFKVGGTNTTLYAPWSSAMAQGQAISLFVRIFNVSKDEKYIDAAYLAMKPLTIKVEDDGLVAVFFGHDYYEEYPTTPASYTLNGFMFTLIGLHDLYEVTNNEIAKQLYDKGIETLNFALPFYDSHGISLYHLGHLFDKNLPIHYAENYHRLHIIELKVLDQFENNDIFKYYSNRWENYVKENNT